MSDEPVRVEKDRIVIEVEKLELGPTYSIRYDGRHYGIIRGFGHRIHLFKLED